VAPIDRVVWDTGVVIGLLEQVEDRYPLIEPFVRDAEAGRLEIVIANTTVVELHGLRGLRKQGAPAEEARSILRDFLSLPYVIRRPLHHQLADEAGELACKLGIKRAADAVALALAVQEKIGLLHTFDGSGSRSGLIGHSGKVGEPLVMIEVPNHGRNTLFSQTDES
jgi:predicted nucleic acid-binding protein